MQKYLTDDEMLRKCQILALACIGSMSEGFDYSDTKAQLEYWGEQRRACSYRGGFVNEFPSNTASRPTAPSSPAGDDLGDSRRGGLCPGR
jgi:hypothetical protein